MPKSDGSIVFSTTLDNSELEKGLRGTVQEIKELEKELKEAEDTKLTLADELLKANEQLTEAEANLESLRNQIEEVNAAVERGELTPDAGNAKTAELTEQLDAQTKKVNEQRKDVEKLAREYTDAEKRVEKLNTRLDQSKAKAKSLGVDYATVYQKASASMNNAFTAMDAKFAAIAGKIQKRMKKLFLFSFIFGALSSFKSYVVDVVKQNDRFSASVENMHAVMKGLVQPAVEALIPVLTGLVTIITQVIITFAKMVDAIFNTNIVASIQSMQNAARYANNEAEATDKQTKATNRLAKAKKAAYRWMAAFDELNVMAAENEDEQADNLDEIANNIDGGEIKPDWDALDVGKIDEKLAEIMLMLGVALMAVGAILCFSGINIPLGITLMAIGALMIYSVASENWEKLPKEVRNAITNLLFIIAGALIVIGVILCLTGNIPLGVAFIIAGALVFVTAVALNWETLSQNIDGKLRELLYIVAGFLAVLGVILCIAGHPVIGVAMIIAGIAIFAITYTTSDENLPETVRNALDVLLTVVAGFLAVIGVLLCINGAIPLGIALIIAGIMIFGIKEEALDEEGADKTVKQHLSSLIDTITPFMLAIGVILCIFQIWFWGIALIVAGIGLLALKYFELDENGLEPWTKKKLSEMISTIAPFVVVIGVILCIFQIWVVGIAAILAGIGLLVYNFVELDENGLKSWTDEKLAEILETISKFLLVIGVVLCVFGMFLIGIAAIIAGFAILNISTEISGEDLGEKIKGYIDEIFQWIKENTWAVFVLGVILIVLGHPIAGVACILAGVWSLVSPETLDTDWILNTVKDVWESIKSYWDTNIAPVFTVEFWQEKFKSITNGLIGQLNNGLGSVDSFINGLSGGLSDILNYWGVEGWSFTITTPKIPYLAQGAVIPPNREFMAVLGDQTSGNNIEAPESLLRQIVREEGGADAQVIALLQSMLNALQQRQTIECDGYTLAKTVNRYNAINQSLYGV